MKKLTEALMTEQRSSSTDAKKTDRTVEHQWRSKSVLFECELAT